MKKVLLLFMCVFALAGAKAEIHSGKFGNNEKQSEWTYDDVAKIATITLNNNGDIKTMENEWGWGWSVPFKDATKMVIYAGEGITLNNDKDEYYILCQGCSVVTFDLSNIKAEAIDQNILTSSNVGGYINNVIVPDDYDRELGAYSTIKLNYFKAGKDATTLNAALMKPGSIGWNDITCKDVNGWTKLNVVSIKDGTASIDLTEFGGNGKIIDLCGVEIAQGATVNVADGCKVIVPEGYGYTISGTATENIKVSVPKKDLFDTTVADGFKTVTINVIGGDSEHTLANILADVFAEGHNDADRIVINGLLDADAVSTLYDALNGEGNGKLTARQLNLSGVTLAEGVQIDFASGNVNNGNLEYIILPNGTTSIKGSMFTGCPVLKAAYAGTYIKDEGGEDSAKEYINGLYAFVKQEGTMHEALTITKNESQEAQCKLEKVVLAGNLMPADISLKIDNNYLDEDGHLAVEITSTGMGTTKTAKGTKGPQDFPSAFNFAPIKHLDLSDAVFGRNSDMNLYALAYGTTITELLLPTATTMTDIPAGCCSGLEQIQSICIPSNYENIGEGAFMLTGISHVYTTPCKNDAEDTVCDYGDNTFTLSSNVKSIGTGAFITSKDNRVTDVYVLATKAPLCARDAFSATMHAGHGGFKGNTVHPICRNNYANNNEFFTMLHFPSGISQSEAEKYTDITRAYSLMDETMATDGNGNQLNWPDINEFNRAYDQAIAGDTWKAWQPEKDYIKYKESWPELWLQEKDAEAVAKKVTEIKDADQYYEGHTYDTRYMGWHQFVLTNAVNYVPADNNDKPHNSGELKKHNWYTLCFPYNITKSELLHLLGAVASDDVTIDGNPVREDTYPDVRTLTHVERDNTNHHITLHFSNPLVSQDEAKAIVLLDNGKVYSYTDAATVYGTENEDPIVIKGGHPYLIKPYLPEGALDGTSLGKYIAMRIGDKDYKEGTTVTTGEGSPVAVPYTEHVVHAIDKNNSTAENMAYVVNSDGTPYTYVFVGAYAKHTLPDWSYYLATGKDGVAKLYRHTNGKAKNWNSYVAIIGANPHQEIVEQEVIGSNSGEKGNLSLTFTPEDDSYTANNGTSEARLTTVFGDDMNAGTTGIDGIADNTVDTSSSSTVYTLNGQAVGSTLNGLAKGIYILNGKKYVIK